jgi:hypothetical protein
MLHPPQPGPSSAVADGCPVTPDYARRLTLEEPQVSSRILFSSGTMFVKAATDSSVRSVQLSELGSQSALPLKRARQGLYTDMAKRGWFTARPDRVRRKWLAIGLAMVVAGVAAVIVAAAGTHHLGLAPIPVALAGLVLIAGARWMPVRTAQGTALARRVEGFRRYIKTTAAAQAHPAGQPDMLYDCLPYAIAFGCTKEWAGPTSPTH